MVKEELPVTMLSYGLVSIGNSYAKIYFPENNIKERVTLASFRNYKFNKAKKYIVSSVVPSLDEKIHKQFSNVEIVKVSDLSLKAPENVGIDRLLNLYAAKNLYKKNNVIVLDMGTAITLTCLKDGVFAGGFIFPGINSLISSLNADTAKLPKIKNLSLAELVLQTETDKAISSGIFNMVVNGINESIGKIINENNKEFLVVGTGGWIYKFMDYLPTVKIVNPDLQLEGLEVYSRSHSEFD